jgi:hypothetical protein
MNYWFALLKWFDAFLDSEFIVMLSVESFK